MQKFELFSFFFEEALGNRLCCLILSAILCRPLIAFSSMTDTKCSIPSRFKGERREDAAKNSKALNFTSNVLR